MDVTEGDKYAGGSVGNENGETTRDDGGAHTWSVFGVSHAREKGSGGGGVTDVQESVGDNTG